MSVIYLTADYHLGHANIIKYCNRPQLKPGDLDINGNWISDEIKNQRASEMSEVLIHNWNMRVKSEDTIYHVGDFCCKGKERGVDGVKTKAKEWLERLNGTKVMILGNHDYNNSLARGLESAVLEAGNLRFFLAHTPDARNFTNTRLLNCDILVCGHIHNQWTTKWETTILSYENYKKDILAINVGVDVHRYMPINLSELIGIANKEIRAHNEHIL